VTPESIAQAAEACAAFEAPSDIHGSAAYRRHVARVLAQRAIALAHGRAGRAPAGGGA
jgi:CO/xanthine dehydrogenase FAD-binding subunit